MKKLKEWDIVEVHWIDSMGDTGWKSKEKILNIATDESMEQLSCGYFLLETNSSIILVQSRSHPNSGQDNVDSSMQIPKVAIKKVIRL